MVLALLIVGVFYGIFIYKKSPTPRQEQQPQTSLSSPAAKTDLQITDEKIGTGKEAKTGNTITVNYIGTLENGAKFDSSYDRGNPFSFVLGQGQVIKGWDQGLIGMKVGGKRKLVIQPSLAYGVQGVSNIIPPNSTLIFEVELLEVK